MSFQEKVKVVSNLEFHRSFFLGMILIGISVLIAINLKWINQRWKEFREKTSPEWKLRNLTEDVNRLSEMDVWLATDLTFDDNNEDYEAFLESNPELLELAKFVIRRLNSICKIELPELIIYPKYFKGIRIFVERGDVGEVKRISSDMNKYVYF